MKYSAAEFTITAPTGKIITALNVVGYTNDNTKTASISKINDDACSDKTLPTKVSSGTQNTSEYDFTGLSSNSVRFSVATAQACLKITATYADASYSITFDSDGGSAVPALPDVSSMPSTFLLPTKDGNVFGGWYTDSECTNLAVKDAAIYANTTLYAKWNEYNYTTNASTEGLTEITTGTTLRLIDLIPNVSKAKDDNTLTTTGGFVAANTIFADNRLHYAAASGRTLKSEKTYTDGSRFTPVLDIKNNRKLTFKLPANCKLTVYGFNPGGADRKWILLKGSSEIATDQPADGFTYIVEEAGTYSLSVNTTGSTANTLQLAAIKVSPAVEPYTVTFDAGANGACGTTELTEASEGAGVTLPYSQGNDGYKFIGWSTNSTPTSADAGASGATYNPVADCTLYAYYTELLPASNVTVTGGRTYQVGDVITLSGSATATNGGEIKGMYGKDNAKAYRWYTCNEDGSNMKPISMQQESTYSPSSAAVGTYYFRFMARESDGRTWYKSTFSGVITVVVEPKTIGNTNCSDVWGSNVTSDAVALEIGKTVTFSFTNYNNNSGDIWNNWNIVSGTDPAKKTDGNSTVLRSDDYYWGNGKAGNAGGHANRSGDWSTRNQTNMNGAHVDVMVSKLNENVVTYYAVMTHADGSKAMMDLSQNYTESLTPTYAWLRVDNSYIRDLEVTTSDIVYRTVSSTKNDAEGGTVTVKVKDTNIEVANGGNVIDGTTVTYSFEAADWYQFDSWYEGQTQLGTTPTYERNVTANTSIQANFTRYYKVDIAANNSEYGDVAISGANVNEAIRKGTQITLTATPKSGYQFVKWTVGSTDKSMSPSFGNKVENVISGATDDKTVVTLTAVFEKIVTPVDPTKVGKEDLTTPYAGAHSQVYTIAAGKTRHITFNNNSAKTKNWDNWVLSIGSTADLAVPESAEDPADIMMLRPDAYEICQRSQIAHEFNWSSFKNDMDGSTVDMYVTNSGKHIYVNATITTSGGKEYKYSAICDDRTAAGTDAFFCFTVEKSYIYNLNVGDETQAYELSYTLKEFGGSAIGDGEGTVTIKNAQGLALRKGTYVPDGEHVTYEAATKADSPRYVYYKWEGAADKTATKPMTVASADVNPVVLFLDKPGVGTPENIVTLSHHAIGTDGFKMYFTLDGSDPKTSASRYEYTPNSVAIRENIAKVRAVACIDGVYSTIQGSNVTYDPVTVLEARGEGVSANGMFTGNTCTPNVGFTNEAKASDGWTNTKSPNSIIDVDEKIYRGQTSSNKITITLNSTSAKKFVVGFVSNASSERAFSSLTVDGSIVSNTNNGQKNLSTREIKRLVITPASEIEQGSEVTFTFNGNVNITYIEVFGTSLEQCEAPEIVPYQYDAINGWSYQVIPATGTTVNYTVNGGAKQTSNSTVTINATDIATGQVIKAWSTKDGMGGSARVNMTDEATIKPVIRFTPSDNATYNKHNSSWVGGVAPTLQIYPASLLTSVTYTTDDAEVGYATNGQANITIGTGQGIAKITASITTNDVLGITNGTFTKELILALTDGYADKLGKNYTPQVGGTREVKDDAGNLILTLGFGGWTHGSKGSTWYADENAAVENTSTGKQTDKWPTTSEYGGDQNQPAKKIDGYTWQSQAETDARSETKGLIEWIADYQFIKPYSLPCRGAYITITPEKNGKLTIYLVQNGCINETGDVGTISGAPRTYYWFDSEGNCIPADDVTVKQPLYFTPTSSLNSKPTFKDQVWTKWGVDLDNKENSTNKELYDALNSHWANLESTDIEHPVPYRGGYFLMKKAYIKYVVTLLAGKTYYFFSNGSKMGYSGLNFAPSESVNIGLPQGGTETVNTVASLTLDDTQAFVAPSKTTAYTTATLNRTFKPNTWNTICLPFSVSKEQVERVFGKGTTFIGYNGYNAATQTLNLVYHAYDYLLPGQPYFILPTGEGVESYTTNIGDAEGKITFHNVTVTSNVAVKDNDNKNDDFQFVGLFNGVTMNTYDHYMDGNGSIVYSSTNAYLLKGYRAYLKNNTRAQAKAIAYSNFDDDMDMDTITGIEILLEQLEEEGFSVVPTGGVYNLSGMKVANDASNLRPGLYIINGKKIYIK